MRFVIYRNDWHGAYVVIGARRRVVGDIFVKPVPGNPKLFEVDQSDDWLFDCEKENPDCYARTMQRLRFIRRGVMLPPDEMSNPWPCSAPDNVHLEPSRSLS